jgi:hypothetical protein
VEVPASSLQVTLVGEPVVANANDVLVELRNEPEIGDEIVTVGGTAAVNVTDAVPTFPAWSVAAT